MQQSMWDWQTDTGCGCALQVQGLMEIFDRDWCNIYSYTVNASSLQHIKRDRDYWHKVYTVLAEFWWGHLIPAKHALAAGDMEAALSYRCGIHAHE